MPRRPRQGNTHRRHGIAVPGRHGASSHRFALAMASSRLSRGAKGLKGEALFPFADGLVAAADAGATAAIQPGGSIRDEEVIKAADERGIAMVFTGIRHFRH